MTFLRQFCTLLQKSNGNIYKIESKDGIILNSFNKNFELITSKKLLEGSFSFLSYWFDIAKDDNIYGVINDKNGTIINYNVINNYIIKSNLLKYDIEEIFIKFIYIKNIDNKTHIFYYSLNKQHPCNGHIIHHYKNNGVWNTQIVDEITYNILTNFVVTYTSENSPVIFYYNVINGFEELFASVFDADSNSWCNPIQITNSRKNKIYLSVIMNSLNCYHILFSENNNNKYFCTYIKGYINNNNKFDIASTSKLVNTVACTFPSIIESNGTLYANWIEYHNLFTVSSKDFGVTWNETSIFNNSYKIPFVCCNYHSNYDINKSFTYFTLFIKDNSLEILGTD